MKTDIYKKKLEEEKALLERELSSIGHVNPNNPTDWIPDPERQEVKETADKNLMGDRHEDFEERAVINAGLEERLANVVAALSRIEDGTYGTCSALGHEIEEDRLEANPAAATCKEHMD